MDVLHEQKDNQEKNESGGHQESEASDHAFACPNINDCTDALPAAADAVALSPSRTPPPESLPTTENSKETVKDASSSDSSSLLEVSQRVDRENSPLMSNKYPYDVLFSSATESSSATTTAATENTLHMADVQSLDRRTQSTPVLTNLLDEETEDDSIEEGGQAMEECVVTETAYRLHPKPVPVTASPPVNINSAPKSTRSMSLSTCDIEHDAEEKSFFGYAAALMGIDNSYPSSSLKPTNDPLEDAWSVATKRKGVYNLIQVPVKLERLLSFVIFICADEFLSTFTTLPLRCFFGILRLFFSSRHKGGGGVNEDRKTKSRLTNVLDILHFSIFIISTMFLSLFDISWVYHNIRGQSVIKLYVVFNVMEIFDRLCSSFGVDLLDSLGWTCSSAVSYHVKNKSASNNSNNNNTNLTTKARTMQSIWLISRVTFDYIFALIYTCLHSLLLLIWVVTLNVAINTKNNALITLLIANNFVELKSSVFKSYKIQNMFQIACSDGVERFQLTIFLIIMLVYTSNRNMLFLTWITIIGCEIVVDWIKHAFATKFNRIPHRVYSQFSMVISNDIASAKAQTDVARSVGGSMVAKRIGFVALPLAVLTARMAFKSVYRMPYPAIALLMATLLCAKIALNLGLLGHAKRKTSRKMSESGSKNEDHLARDEDDLDAKWYESLVNLGRYDLISKS